MKKFTKNLEKLVRVVGMASGFLLFGGGVTTVVGVATDNQTMTDIGYCSFVLGAVGKIAVTSEEEYFPERYYNDNYKEA